MVRTAFNALADIDPGIVYSMNDRAKMLCGDRVKPGRPVVFIDLPCELGFHCPVCTYEQVDEFGNYDERLDWSEYRMFMWCAVCNVDYPSVLCHPDPIVATNMFLDCIEETIEASVA